MLVALAPEAPLEPARLEPCAALRPVGAQPPQTDLELAQQRTSARAGTLGTPRRHRGGELLERGGERLRREAGRACARLQAPERLLEHGVGYRSAAHRLRIRLGPLRPQHAVDEPADAAAGEGLQPAGGLGLA